MGAPFSTPTEYVHTHRVDKETRDGWNERLNDISV